jgi:fatty-acid peroxygenase
MHSHRQSSSVDRLRFGGPLALAGAFGLGVMSYRLGASLSRHTSPFPSDANLDSTLSFLREGYRFTSRRCERYRSDVFETRLMMRKVFCARGEEAARMFYAPGRFTRRHAMPLSTLLLLQDLHSVQTLDGDAHRARKQMFLSLLTAPERIQQLVDVFDEEWTAGVRRWAHASHVVLHDAASEVLCRAVCRWAGVPLRDDEAAERTQEFVAMIEGSGHVGPKNWRAQRLRLRTEQWVADLIDRVRRGGITAPADSALLVIAGYRGPDGRLLSTATATVELLNVLRPTVAVARFITFAALALHDYPEIRRQLEDDVAHDARFFVQEVRRFYPFFPAIGGRVLNEFEWRGHRFTTGTWVLLDLYGTNHDPRSWHDPGTFRPDRFSTMEQNEFNYIPQGGGAHAQTHRCPGEPITIDLMLAAVRQLMQMRYDVPIQDLRIDMANMPALPASRFVISNCPPLFHV